METTTTFEAGCTYTMHWITDHTLRPLVTVTSRTARFVTLQFDDGTTKRCGVTVVDGEEVAYPHGRYSMCPILRSSAKEPPMHCTEPVPGDPDGCARCGEAEDLHERSTTSHDGCERCNQALRRAKTHARLTGSVGATFTYQEVDGTEHQAEWHSGQQPVS